MAGIDVMKLARFRINNMATTVCDRKRNEPTSAVLSKPAYHEELIDGKRVQKALPKRLHISVQKHLTAYFDAQLPDFLEALPELNIIVGQDRLIPDITVASKNAMWKGIWQTRRCR